MEVILNSSGAANEDILKNGGWQACAACQIYQKLAAGGKCAGERMADVIAIIIGSIIKLIALGAVPA